MSEAGREYAEKVRIKRQRNQDKLASLGLLQIVSEMASVSPPRVRKRRHSEVQQNATRRSGREAIPPVDGYGDRTFDWERKRVDRVVKSPKVKSPKVRATKSVWSAAETLAVKMGVERFGVSYWAVIKDHYAETLSARTSVMIKDRWRTMVRLNYESYGMVLVLEISWGLEIC